MGPTIFTTAGAAEYLEISEGLVCRYCRAGRLDATKVGRDWLIYKPALDRFKRLPRKPGNPQFQKHTA